MRTSSTAGWNDEGCRVKHSDCSESTNGGDLPFNGWRRRSPDAIRRPGRSAPRRGATRKQQGKESADNVERHHFGAKRSFAFTPRQHFELGEALGQMDFDTAAKLSGARFVVLRGPLARLERALAAFMLDMHTSEHGYTEIDPPLL